MADILGSKISGLLQKGRNASSNNLVGTFGGIGQQLAGMTLFKERFNDIKSELNGEGVVDSTRITKGFVTDLLVQASLAESPEIPSPYFAPLLFCTESDSIWGNVSTTNGVVAFSFQDIGNLFVEDSSMPRAIPVQQVPDSNQDNVQDMGRSSGYIKISGRVFGQAGLSRFEMLRSLCNYKGKKGLVFIDKNIGKFRVYPANIPGFTTSAEFFNQYAFQLTFIVVSETNKQTDTHRKTKNVIRNTLALANSLETTRAQLFRSLDSFKRIMSSLTLLQRKEELLSLLSQFSKLIPDEKLDAILDVIIDGFDIGAIFGNEKEYPNFAIKAPRQTVYLRNIVPSKVMNNGFIDGTQKEFWLPKREVGEVFDIYYKRVFNQLTEDDIPDQEKTNIEADKGALIEGSIWKKMNSNSDYTVVDITQRPNYPGEWTKIIFNTPPLKWGIIKVNYSISKDLEYELFNGDSVLFGEELMYIDKIKGSIEGDLICKDVVPLPISGSNLNVIESNNVTELYVPELFDDIEILKNVKIKKRIGSISDSKMEEIQGFDVVPSVTVNGMNGKWGKIILQQGLNIGDFVSIDVVFKNVPLYFENIHPDYTIKNEAQEIKFKWLRRPRVRVMGNLANNLVLSPNLPNSSGLYHIDFLTDGETNIYWVKGGIDTNNPIKIKLSDGKGILQDLPTSSFSYESISARVGHEGIWGKITLNETVENGRILVIDCRLRENLNMFKGTFSNSDILYGFQEINLLWMQAIEDYYADSTFKNIYPIPEGYTTGRNGFISADISEFWIPDIIINELYPLKVKVNRNIVSNYTIETNVDKVVGTTVQKWTKLKFSTPLKKGMLLTVDFTAIENISIYEQNYLEEIPKDIYSDDCEPFKNSLGTKEYYTPFAIDTSKPLEVRIDGVMLPKDQYTIYKAANRVYVNKDGATISELMGLIKFLNLPGDNTDIYVKYNRLETPMEEELILSRYLAVENDKFRKIKEYYLRNKIVPLVAKVPINNNGYYDLVRKIYSYPVDGTQFVTYAYSTEGTEFYYTRFDGIGEKYVAKIRKYSFQFNTRITYNTQNISKFGNQNTPMSLDLSIPKQGQQDWMDRYNSLVAIYPDPTPQQERELTSMILGKLVGQSDYSDNNQITDADIANAKLWLQVYNSYVESSDFVEAQKMLDERTSLLQIGVDSKPKEQDSIYNVTIPSENPNPVDLPPISGWKVQETISIIKYTKDLINIELYGNDSNICVSLMSNYRAAIKSGIAISVKRNQYGMLFFDASKNFRISISSGATYEEYQFNYAKDLIDAIKNGQILIVNGASVTFKKSEIITESLLILENAILTTFNDSYHYIDTFEIDKYAYETFLLAIYGDVDAISRARRHNYNKYIKFQEIIGRKEASLSLDDGLNFYRFSKLKPVKEN